MMLKHYLTVCQILHKGLKYHLRICTKNVQDLEKSNTNHTVSSEILSVFKACFSQTYYPHNNQFDRPNSDHSMSPSFCLLVASLFMSHKWTQIMNSQLRKYCIIYRELTVTGITIPNNSSDLSQHKATRLIERFHSSCKNKFYRTNHKLLKMLGLIIICLHNQFIN